MRLNGCPLHTVKPDILRVKAAIQPTENACARADSRTSYLPIKIRLTKPPKHVDLGAKWLVLGVRAAPAPWKGALQQGMDGLNVSFLSSVLSLIGIACKCSLRLSCAGGHPPAREGRRFHGADLCASTGRVSSHARGC